MSNFDRWSDQQVELSVSLLLRLGVTLAAITVSIGGLLYLISNGSEVPHDHIFRGEPATLRQFSGILETSFTLQGQGIIQLGILLLILTPIVRVAFSVFAFWKQRDCLYTMITLTVLMILIHSLLATE
jgi:uncharacterized membrane protein